MESNDDKVQCTKGGLEIDSLSKKNVESSDCVKSDTIPVEDPTLCNNEIKVEQCIGNICKNMV